MTRKQKKDLGVLPIQVLSRVRKLGKSGEITREMTSKEAAVVLALDVASCEECHDEWAKVEVGSVDWDSLLAFIEKLLAILLPLFMPQT